nr:AAA family ATPase [Candidatus Woesearchaeota archaeon]
MEDFSIWIEKYRPKTFSEFKGHPEIKARVEAFVKNKNMPHLIFAGPAGVGKTTLALIIAKELYGEYFRNNFLELNASDDRGIDIVRNEIKDFARIKPFGNIPFKIIFLDEADALTREAQNALRRTMENYAISTRFILSCVTPETKVVLKDETEINIGDIKKINSPNMICIDTDKMSIEKDVSLIYIESSTKITGKKIIKLGTDTCRSLNLTDDHLVFTKEGWKPGKNLSEGDYIAVLPTLEGTPPPKEGTILNEEDIEEQLHMFEKDTLNKKEIGNAKYYGNLTSKSIKKLRKEIQFLYEQNGLNKSEISRRIKERHDLDLSVTQITRIINGKTKNLCEKIVYDLKKRGLLPLNNSSQRIGILLRLIGYLFGDGNISEKRDRITFVGAYKALEEIKKELMELGFKTTEIETTKKKVVIKGRKTKGTSHALYVYSRSLWILLKACEVPTGNKCIKSYAFPAWILSGPKFIKREFLRGFFDAEMSKPVLDRKSPTIFSQLALTQHKIKPFENSCFEFIKHCQNLLNEFGVVSYIKNKTMPYKRKDGNDVTRFQLKISSTNKNLLNFFSRIGFYYEGEKRRLGRLAHEYLRYKKNFIERLKSNSKDAVQVFNEGGNSKVSIANDFGISISLLTNQIQNKPINITRNFPSFYKWANQHRINGNSDMVWNKVTTIQEVSGDIVCDLSLPKFHNFIGNGFLLHNCNFSSKIIDPIQSRCTVFRFKPLDKKEIKQIVETISKKESIKIDDSAVQAIIDVSSGDLRRVENILQSSAAVNNKITEESIYEIISAAKPKEINQILTLAIKNDFIKARELLLETMLKHGLSGLDVIKQIQEQIWDLEIDDKKKVEMIEKCGEVEFRIVEGSDEYLQLESLLASFTK